MDLTGLIPIAADVDDTLLTPENALSPKIWASVHPRWKPFDSGWLLVGIGANSVGSPA